ncbi:transglutaminaseTgpA domain-containing protein, partial [Paracidovorax anthurii]
MTALRHTLASLPRETRDTLFLLVTVGWIMLPLVPHVPVWTGLLAAGLLAWRGALALRAQPLPGHWMLGLLLAASVVLTVASHRTIVGRDAGVTLIVMLLALKTLELRARRDAMVIFFLGFFTMLSNFFFSQSLATAAAMLVALLGLLAALVNAHMPVGRPPLAEPLRLAGRMALLGAPVMLALFVLFPRMAPLWGMPNDNPSGRSGLSGKMEVGSVASLALDDGIALRVRFDTPDGDPPSQSALYFRGPVLSAFDGREWFAFGQPGAPASAWRPPAPAALEVRGEPLRYEVTLEALRMPWLLTLDAAREAPALPPGLSATMTPELAWIANRPISEVVRYRAESYTDFSHGPRADTPRLRPYLELPEGFDPRTRELARQMQADARIAAGGAPAFIDAALQRLRTGGYEYTLEPGVYAQHTADTFWFDRKAGFCEHIASAFVVLLRAAGIPARIVTGYQGGERNGVDGYWTVRQADAHAWTEVWLAGQGWVRVDPTGAVSPGRVGAFQRLQAPRGVFGAAVDTVIGPGFIAQARAVWEAVNNRWNQWVLNYTQSQQLDLLKSLGVESPSWQDLARALGGLAALAALVGAAWTIWERRRHDPWLRLLGRARGRLARAGLALPAHLPPRAMAQRARDHFGDAAAPA